MTTNSTIDPKAIETLQELIRLNLDSQEGLHEAAQYCKNENVAQLFRTLAEERGRQASELRQLVSSYGQNPEDDGTYAAAAHRTLINIRGSMGGGAKEMLVEAERGEDYIKAAYENAAQDRACTPLTEVLNEHYRAVTDSHNRVRNLRDAAK